MQRSKTKYSINKLNRVVNGDGFMKMHTISMTYETLILCTICGTEASNTKTSHLDSTALIIDLIPRKPHHVLKQNAFQKQEFQASKK
jgi:hypothetical protein